MTAHDRSYDEGRADGLADRADWSHEDMLHRRGIHADDQCQICWGYGVRCYSHGSTWRGGMGTTGGRHDVCDSCWGSGSALEKWLDLRTYEAETRRLVAERAVELLARTAGVDYSTARDSVVEIVAALDVLSRKRNTASWTPWLANDLANAIRRGIGVPEVKRR